MTYFLPWALLALATIASYATAQERPCEADRDQLRILARNLADDRLSKEVALADVLAREIRLRAQVEELKKAATPSPPGR